MGIVIIGFASLLGVLSSYFLLSNGAVVAFFDLQKYYFFAKLQLAVPRFFEHWMQKDRYIHIY